MPQHIADYIKIKLKKLQNHIDDMKVLAKSRCYYKLGCNIHDMNVNLLVYWEFIYILKVGDKAHHKKTNNMKIKKGYGTMAKNYEENVRFMKPHFQKIFNNHQPTDSSVLDLIKQQKTIWYLNYPITWNELNWAINGLESMKAAGLNGLPSESFKSMVKYCRRYVFDFINEFWHDRADFCGCNKIQCVSVPKSGEFSDTNKFRGVMRMDVMSKIFGCVINVRLFEILDAYGKKIQFGWTPKIGCSDGLFTVKTLFNMKKIHNLPTFVDFVDLVKCFDTASHKLLIKLLERCGAPPKFFSYIHKMYQDLIVVLNIGNSI